MVFWSSIDPPIISPSTPTLLPIYTTHVTRRCHGEQNNCVYALASKLNLLEPSQNSLAHSQLIQSDGTVIAAPRTARLLQLVDALDATDAELAAAPSGTSVGQLATAKFAVLRATDEYRDLFDGDGDALADQFLNACDLITNVLEASDSWFDISARAQASYEECAGNQLLAWKGRGYRTIFDVLLRRTAEQRALGERPSDLEQHIAFGKRVQLIEWSGAGAAGAVRLVCDDGTELLADHVIWTGSLGVLRAHHAELFRPALPERKRLAIEAHRLGTVAKVYVDFERPFWPTDGSWSGFTALWRAEERRQLRAAGDGDAADDDSWLLWVSGVFRVDYHPTVLCVWVTGEGARQQAALAETPVRRAVMRLLRMFMGGAVPEAAEPRALRRSQWDREPNALGSYSYATLLADEGVGVTRADLAEPLWRPQGGGGGEGADAAAGWPAVLFAGEATSERHATTVHGAVETGWREADRLLKLGE